MTKVKRYDDVMTITLDARTWDIECKTIWEKLLYVEYCSWSGHKVIDLSISTIAHKLATTMTDYSKRTIENNLEKARKTLIDRGIIKDIGISGYRNTKLINLTDTYKTRQLKKYATKYGKERAKLYQKDILVSPLEG